MPSSMERWAGKVAIVTGASSGIGEAIAKCLVNEGLQVVGVARRKDRLDALAASLSTSKGTFHPYVGDVSKESDIISAFNFAKTFGPIHILINNAGICNNNTLHDGDAQKWRDILEVNVIGLSVATREAVRDMRRNGVDGHIVHINSIAGHKLLDGLHMYPPSKFAVTALTESLRREINELGLKVKVTSISPGSVRTNIVKHSNLSEEFQRKFYGGLLLEVEDIADAVLYVLGTPKHVQVHELTIRPIGETL